MNKIKFRPTVLKGNKKRLDGLAKEYGMSVNDFLFMLASIDWYCLSRDVITQKCAKTHTLWCKREWEKEYNNNKAIPRYPSVFAQYKELFRNVYVTVFDSCQKFVSKVDEKKEEILFQSLINLAKDPMKSIFRGRGKHHIRLVLDGLVKFRCIFEDFSSDFEANEKDFDNAERILIEMVQNWDFDMSIKKEELWKSF